MFFTSSVLDAKKRKKLLPADIKGKKVTLEKIILMSHANTLSKDDMNSFIENNMPALVEDFKIRFEKKYNAVLDISAYQEKVKKKKLRIRLNKMSGVVMGRWKNRKKSDLNTMLSITIKNIKRKITVAGVTKMKDPEDPKNPFKSTMSYFYFVK
jgi:hypothetical protein